MNKKYVLKIIGNIFTVISLAFIVHVLLNLEIDYSAVLMNPFNVIVLCILAMLSGIQYLISAYAWKVLLSGLSGQQIAFKPVLDVYSRANLAKYLPGNVMHFAGRNLLGAKLGLRQVDIAAATVMEIVLSLAAAFFFALLTSAKYLYQLYMIIRSNPMYMAALMGLLILGGILLCVLTIFVKKNSIFRKELESLLQKRMLPVMLKGTVIYLSTFALTGVINLLIYVLLLRVVVPTDAVLSVLGLTVISWIAGFIVPGAPGGIGIRESVMILLVTPLLGREPVALAAILLRIVNIAGDFILFLGNFLWQRNREARQQTC